jgi:hypothetical protein
MPRGAHKKIRVHLVVLKASKSVKKQTEYQQWANVPQCRRDSEYQTPLQHLDTYYNP